MQWDLYKHDSTGERYMVGHRGGRNAGKRESVDRRLCMHMDADLVVTVMRSIETTLPVHVFQHPRAFKSRVYWPSPHIYEFSGLTSHGGIPSKWISKGKASWQHKVASAFGEGDVFCHSIHANVGEVVVDLPVYKRCLRNQSIATPGLLWLAALWSCCTHNQGGLRDTIGKKNMTVLLNAMLAVASRDCTTGLMVDNHWTCRWLRPPSSVESGCKEVDVIRSVQFD